MPRKTEFERFCENLGANFLSNAEDILMSQLTNYLESNGVSSVNLRTLGIGETPNSKVKSPFLTNKVAVSPEKKKKKAKVEKVEQEKGEVIDMVEENGVWV